MPEGLEVLGPQGLGGPHHTGVLRDDVPGAPELLAREATEVPFGGVAQSLDAQSFGRPLAGRPPVVGPGLAEAGGVLVHDAARDAGVLVLGALADPGEALLVQADPEERVEGERRRGLYGRRGGEPRRAGHVSGERGPETADVVAGLTERPGDAARVPRPRVVLAAQRAGFLEVRGEEQPFVILPAGDRYAAVDGTGEDEAAVVVRVLPYQVDAPRRARDDLGLRAEPLDVRFARPRLRLPHPLLVPPRVLEHPGPGVRDHVLQARLLGFPPEVGPDRLAGGYEFGRVPRPPRRLLGPDIHSRDLPGRLDDLEHGEPRAVAQVVDPVPAGLRGLQRYQVGPAQVFYVNVVADGGAVAGRVVGAEDLHRFSCTRGGLEDYRVQVRLRLVVLPERPANTRDVDVPQARRRQAPRPRDVTYQAVDGELGVAVGVGRPGWVCLEDGNPLRLPVDGGRGGEDETGHAGLPHRFEQLERTAHVVPVVALRLLDGLGHKRERREVEHPVVALGERLRHELPVEQGAPGEPRAPGHGVLVALGEVVEDDRLVAGLDELGGDDAPDVPRPARDEQLQAPAPSTALRSVPAVSSGS